MSKREVYLDHAASSLIHPAVIQHLTKLFQQQLGNPSSIHHAGVKASLLVEKARISLAERLGCHSEEIFFTSGATEANNLVIKGLCEKYKNGSRNEVLISAIEHSSIARLGDFLTEHDFVLKIIPVDNEGLVDLSALESMLSSKTFMVSVIHGNNEIGTIQDLKTISRLCKNSGAFFHSDGAQAFCKTPVDFHKNDLDFYSLSAHKIHGPRGIGAIIIKNGKELAPQMIGGGQESGVRSGTLPVELISAMAFAASLYTDQHLQQMQQLQRQLISGLGSIHPAVRLNGSITKRLCNNINFAVPGISGKKMLQKMDQKGIRLSVGSACNASKKTPSNVLLALGQSNDQVLEAVRVSLGLETTIEDIDYFLHCLQEIVSET